MGPLGKTPQVGEAEIGVFQLCSLQVCLGQLCLDKIGTVELTAFALALIEVLD